VTDLVIPHQARSEEQGPSETPSYDVLNALHTAAYVVNPDYTVGWLNEQGVARLGVMTGRPGATTADFLGMDFTPIYVHPELGRELVRTDRYLPLSTRYEFAGGVREMEVKGIYGRSGGYLGALVVARDVTEEVRNQQALADNAADTATSSALLRELGGVRSETEAMQTALDVLCERLELPYLAYWRITEDDRMVHHQDAGVSPIREQGRALDQAVTWGRGEGLCGKAWLTGDLFYLRDVASATDAEWAGAQEAAAAGIKSALALPITSRGKVVGAIEAAFDRELILSDQRKDAMRSAAQIISRAVDRAREAERQAAEIAATTARVEELLAFVEKIASGDLTAETGLVGDDHVGRMGRALNGLVAALRRSLTDIGGTANVLGGSADQLTSLSQRMDDAAALTSERAASASSASVQVSASIQTVATAAEQMTASIREIAKNATEAATVATEAVGVAGGAETTVASLGESSAEIGQVLKVITSIAQQTNLLALNATIEAARAGDAGKGFAVVANEVKELAKETAKATEDISHKIEAIQSDTQGAVSAIGRIAEVIGKINDIQATIASAVEEQTATTNEIARSVTEAAAGANEIAADVTQVATAAAETRQGVENTLRSATELTGMATELRSLVGQFRL
jgi:methyl-accepting chemotaxis protein